MTDTARNSYIMVGVLVGLFSIWGMSTLWHIVTRRSREKRFHSYPEIHPFQIAEMNIPTDGHLSPAERAWFDELHEILDHGTKPINYVETAMAEYVARCRRERRLVDSHAIHLMTISIDEARRRRIAYVDGRFQLVRSQLNSTRKTEEVMNLLEDAVTSQNPPRERTIMWERET